MNKNTIKKKKKNFRKYQTTLASSLTRTNPLSNKLPNHISEAFLAAASKYKIFSELCRWGGGEIPKGGRAGRARFLGIWPPGGARSLGIWPRGGRDHGGRNSWDTGVCRFDTNEGKMFA